MSIKEAIKKVDPDREYNLSQIKVEGIFPWVKDIRTIRAIVKKDLWGENMLKSLITGEGRGMDYKIKGKNIIKFLEKYGSGMMMSAPQKIN